MFNWKNKVPFFFSGFFLFVLFLGVGAPFTALLLDVLLPFPLDVSLLLLFSVKVEGSSSLFGSDFFARADKFFLYFVEMLFPGYKKQQKMKKKLSIDSMPLLRLASTHTRGPGAQVAV